MTSEERLARADGLYVLSVSLPGEDFGGHPACAGDPELFFPEPDELTSPTPKVQEQIDEAKAVCAGCDLLVSCRENAIRRGHPYGIWGGLTPVEIAGERAARGLNRTNGPVPVAGVTAVAAEASVDRWLTVHGEAA